MTFQVAQLGLLNVLIRVGGGCFVEAVDPALWGRGMATPTGSRPWRRLHVSLERIAVLFEGVKGAGVLEDVLVLHDDVYDDEAGGARRKIHPALVVLILAKEELSLLRVVEAFKDQPGDHHAHLLAMGVAQPVAHKLCQILLALRGAPASLGLIDAPDQVLDY